MKLALALVARLCLLALAGAETAVPDFDHLRQSVVRIQAVSAGFNWLHPFMPGQDGVGLGSGFVVQTRPYPLFVTNAHVINDAKQVTLQLLLYGEHQWEAEVVSVCSKFDLALLVLKEPNSFHEAMGARNITLGALQLAKGTRPMGEDVVALGFPLGQDALKISKGNIAGNEDVDGNICIQSTAPISPGSSGGPLLDSEARVVVGVNFAKATEGENINYVIPAWRVQQMVFKHLHDQPMMKDGEWRRVQVKVPRPEVTTVEANEALYALSGGCDRGIYLSRVGERSLFKKARPAVPAGSFLTAVNGRALDRFGMGLHGDYVADRVAFSDLFFMVPDLSADVYFETCFHGNVTRHNVSMAWAPEYDRGIRYVDEPHMAGKANAYELFGDISVMEMTINHISAILSSSGDPGPARWLHPDFVAKPRLIINYVRSGSYVADVLPVGSAVTRVNGEEVQTLEEFRQHFVPKEGQDVWTLETDIGKVVALMFNRSLAEQLERATMMNAYYLLTPGVVGAAKKLGFMKDGGAPAAASLQKSPRNTLQAFLASRGASHGRKQSLLAGARAWALAPDDELGSSMEARAAGPLLAQFTKRGTGRTTRAAILEL